RGHSIEIFAIFRTSPTGKTGDVFAELSRMPVSALVADRFAIQSNHAIDLATALRVSVTVRAASGRGPSNRRVGDRDGDGRRLIDCGRAGGDDWFEAWAAGPDVSPVSVAELNALVVHRDLLTDVVSHAADGPAVVSLRSDLPLKKRIWMISEIARWLRRDGF